MTYCNIDGVSSLLIIDFELDSKDFHFNVGWIIKLMPMWSSISMVASPSHPSWAPHSNQKINTPSPSVNSFHVKGQQNHLGVNDIEVTSPSGKGKDKLDVGRIDTTFLAKAMEKVMVWSLNIL
jgi:hypothetical protein